MSYEVKAIVDGVWSDFRTSNQGIAMCIYNALTYNAQTHKVTECYYLENKEIKSYFLA